MDHTRNIPFAPVMPCNALRHHSAAFIYVAFHFYDSFVQRSPSEFIMTSERALQRPVL